MCCARSRWISMSRELEIERSVAETGLKVGGIFQNRCNPVMGPTSRQSNRGALEDICGILPRELAPSDEYFLANGG